MILQDSKPGLSLQLLIVESHEVGLRLLDLKVHLFGQFLHILDLFKLSLIDSNHTLLLVILKLGLQRGYVFIKLLLLVSRCLHLDQPDIQVRYSVSVLIELFLVLFLQFSVIVLELGLLSCILLNRLVRDVLQRFDSCRLLVFGGQVPFVCFFLLSKMTVTTLFKAKARFNLQCYLPVSGMLP